MEYKVPCYNIRYYKLGTLHNKMGFVQHINAKSVRMSSTEQWIGSWILNKTGRGT